MMRYILLAAILFIAPAAGAQAISAAGPGVRLESVIGRLDGNTTLRVRTATATTQGRFAGTNADGLLLVRREGIDPPIPLDAVMEMWKLGNSTVKGATIGAVTGGAILGGLGIIFITGMCESTDGCTGEGVRVGFMGGVIGAGAGALLGSIFGSLVQRWVRIHP